MHLFEKINDLRAKFLRECALCVRDAGAATTALLGRRGLEAIWLGRAFLPHSEEAGGRL